MRRMMAAGRVALLALTAAAVLWHAASDVVDTSSASISSSGVVEPEPEPVAVVRHQQGQDLYTTAAELTAVHSWNVSCVAERYEPRVDICHTHACARFVIDNFLSPETVATLLEMAKRGMMVVSRPDGTVGGPTILDLNAGLARSTLGVRKVYPAVSYSQTEFDVYRAVFDKIRNAIKQYFGLGNVWFTAPTFVARLNGEAGWEPAEIHDEYWHPHVDKNNTEHYDYSGLVYLTTHGQDFTGGKFVFIDEHSNHTIEPRAGRLLLFTSGMENLHQVQRVESGERFTMSMWFTCDERREFDTFLDGAVHRTFKNSPGSKKTTQKPTTRRRKIEQ